MRYRDFKIKIESVSDQGYSVSIDSPAGEEQTVIQLPYPVDEILEKLQQIGGLVRGETRKAEVAAEVEITPSELGAALFTSLFSGSIGTAYNRSLGMCSGDEEGLRVKLVLNLQDDEVRKLATVPWEYLCENQATEGFLSLSRKTPIVRYVEALESKRDVTLESALRVLVVLSSPDGVAKLDLTKEKELIEQSWANESSILPAFLENPTAGELFDKLSSEPFHVLHYMGHGSPNGLILSDDNKQATVLSASTFGVWLGDMPSLRLVFLNACDTAKVDESSPLAGVATRLVTEGLPAVVAMQFPISDAAAIGFARTFYTQLVAGSPVDEAVAQGRKAILAVQTQNLEWGTPVLFMRAPDGYLFSNHGATEAKGQKTSSTQNQTGPRVIGGLASVLTLAIAGVGLFLWSPWNTSSPLQYVENPIVVNLGEEADARLRLSLPEGERASIDDLESYEPIDFESSSDGSFTLGKWSKDASDDGYGWRIPIRGESVSNAGKLTAVVEKGTDRERTISTDIHVVVAEYLVERADKLADDLDVASIPTQDLIPRYAQAIEANYEPATKVRFEEMKARLEAVVAARNELLAHNESTLLSTLRADYSAYGKALKDVRGFDLQGSFDDEIHSKFAQLPEIAAQFFLCRRPSGLASGEEPRSSCSDKPQQFEKGARVDVFLSIDENSSGEARFTRKILNADGGNNYRGKAPRTRDAVNGKRWLEWLSLSVAGDIAFQLETESGYIVARHLITVNN